MRTSDQIKKVYENMQDNLSKLIFINRFQYMVSNNNSCFFAENDFKVNDCINNSNVSVVIFGLDNFSKTMYEFFNTGNINVIGFCSSNTVKKGRSFCNLPILTINEVIECKFNPYIYFATPFLAYKEIRRLIRHGFPTNRIIRNNNDDFQYFDISEIEPVQDEIFLDCGAYNGDTIIKFINWSKNKYKKNICYRTGSC